MVMKQLQSLFGEGGKVIWVAPSGGRDREGEKKGRYVVAPFDAKSIEMFRLMSDKAGRTTHFYPLSMLTYPICPPPQQVGGDVGEQRIVKWSPAGLHFGECVDLNAFNQACLGKDFPADCAEGQGLRDALRDALADHLHKIVSTNYEGLAEKLEAQL